MKILSLIVLTASLIRCEENTNSDAIQSAQQEKILQEGTSTVGMPAIHNFRERRLLKEIYELRDQADVSTYTYTFSPVSGLKLLCISVGYGIPYATQYTNPQKLVRNADHGGYTTLTQADPNGLYSPSSANGTWVMCKDPNGSDVKPVHVEPDIISAPFKLIP